MIRAAALGLVIGGLAAPMAAFAADSAPAGGAAGDDPVVARVDGGEIHRSEVLTAMASLPAQVRQMPAETIFPAMLDQLVNSRLVAAAADRQKLRDDPEFQEKLKHAELRVLQEIYLTRAVKAKITDEALKQQYQKYLEKYVAEHPPQDEVRASHILVATEAEAKALIAQLKGGADFAKLAKEKSTDAAAAAQGGDLGFFTRDAMVAPFAEAAFAGTPGQVIPTPVHTEFGWHVIRVDERRKAAPPSFDDVRGDLENELSQDIVAQVVAELRAGAKVEEFQMDGSPQAKETPKEAPAAAH
jgi:peptidyl-prolyl cis-trans isomerase C